MKTVNLKPNPLVQKSFYGKSKKILCDDGWTFLKSYKTIVAGVDPRCNTFRFWYGRSNTTGRHVVAFFAEMGKNIKARDFYKWPVDSVPPIHSDLEEEI